MDEYEANLIILTCSPTPIRRSTSPQTVASYSLSQKMVQSCKNCKYSFRSEFKPNAEYCSKDCETSYRWFMKKADSFESAGYPSHHQIPTNRAANRDTQYYYHNDKVTRCTSERILPGMTTNRMNEFKHHSRDGDDETTVIPFDDVETISSRTSSPTTTRKEYKTPTMIYADDSTKSSNQYFTGVRAMFRGILL